MQRQAVDDHFQTPVVSSHKHFPRSMSRKNMFVTTLPPNFPVDSGGRTLQSEASPSQSPSSNMLRGDGQKDRMAGHTRWDKERRGPQHTAHSVTSTMLVPRDSSWASDQEGTSNPSTPSRVVAALQAEPKHGEMAPPSKVVHDEILHFRVPSPIIGNVSAQLAQLSTPQTRSPHGKLESRGSPGN